MPDNFDNLIFGAQFKPDEFIAGIDKSITALTNVGKKNDELTEKDVKLTKQLELKKKQIDALNQSIAGLTKTSDNYEKESAALTTQLDKQTKSYEKMQAQLINVQKQLKEVGTTNDKVQESISKSKSVAPQINNPQSPINLNVNTSQALTKLQQLKEAFYKVFANPGDFLLDDEMKQLVTTLQTAKGDFDTIGKTVDVLKQKLVQLEPGTQQFTDVSEAIKTGNVVLNEYAKLYTEATKAVETSEPVYKSIRGRMLELRQALLQLEDAGQDETREYKEKQTALARLTDQYGDMQQQIRILASDTKYLDFGLSAINAAAAGFQVFSGALELFGVKNEDAAEAQRKLLAIMNLVQGLQQLQNLLLKENIIRTVGAKIATEAYVATQRVFAVVLGTTTGAVRTLSAALLTTGIGALVIGLGYLISALVEWADKSDDAAAAQLRLKTSIDGVNNSLNKNLLLLNNAKDVDLTNAKIGGASPQKLFEIEKDYREREISNLETANIKRKILYNQSLNDDNIAVEEKNKLAADANAADVELAAKRHQLLLFDLNEELRVRNEQRENGKKYLEDRKKLLQDAKNLEDQIRVELSLYGKSDEEKELLQLQQKYNKEKQVFIKAGKDFSLLTELYEKQRSDITEKYRKLRLEAEQSIFNELEALQAEANTKRIENIQDQYRQQTAAINDEAAKQRTELQSQQNEQLNTILQQKLAAILTPAEADEAASNINAAFDRLFNELEINTQQKLQQLSFSIFETLKDDADRTLKFENLGISEGSLARIKQETDLYTQGKISYKQYQDSLTQIAQDEAAERFNILKASLTNEIALLQQSLKSGFVLDKNTGLSTGKKLTDSQKKQLQDDIADLQQQLTDAEAGNLKSGAANKDAEQQTRLTNFGNYVGTVNSLIDSIGQAWLNAADNEAKALDRSITIQERRVDAATRIAERGNATYLKMEEQKMDELTRKQEANARRQIAINAALQGSQILVAITGAVSKLAIPGVGIAEAVAEIAVIVGAIASGYALVKSLQSNQPSFYSGVEDTGRGGNVDNKGGFKAILHPNERVMTAEQNKQLGNMKNEEVVKVVQMHKQLTKQPSFANVDYARLEKATQFYVSHDSKLSAIMQEHSDKMDRVNDNIIKLNKSIRNISNSVNIDRHGLNISLMAEQEQILKDKKA